MNIDKTEKFAILVISFCFLFVIGVVVQQLFIHVAESDACANLPGFEKLITLDKEYFCLSYSGEAHYVDFECNGLFFGVECDAKIITKGNMRTIDVRGKII